jgi:NADH-quinone oxidoreductase subunit I
MGTPGSGLARGLAITFRAMTRRAHTRQYPDHPPELPPRSRGVIALFEENCTVCMLCARECPDWCIYIDSHKESVQAEGAARARQRNVLDRFAIDFSLCMYCGICIEVCPFDALFWAPEFEYAEYDIRDMTHEKERLREWMWTVPPPPPLDPLAEPAKEVAAVEKARVEAVTPVGETRTPRDAPESRPARATRGDAGGREARPEPTAREPREPGAPRESRPGRVPGGKAGNGVTPDAGAETTAAGAATDPKAPSDAGAKAEDAAAEPKPAGDATDAAAEPKPAGDATDAEAAARTRAAGNGTPDQPADPAPSASTTPEGTAE